MGNSLGRIKGGPAGGKAVFFFLPTLSPDTDLCNMELMGAFSTPTKAFTANMPSMTDIILQRILLLPEERPYPVGLISHTHQVQISQSPRRKSGTTSGNKRIPLRLPHGGTDLLSSGYVRGKNSKPEYLPMEIHLRSIKGG